jgi:hypothetical protein
MSPKQRFPVMLEPSQLAGLKTIEARTGARVSEQIRRAIDRWLEEQGDDKAERKRAVTRKRS